MQVDKTLSINKIALYNTVYLSDPRTRVPVLNGHRHFRGRPVLGFVAKVLSVAFGLVMCSAEHLAVGDALLFCLLSLPVVDRGGVVGAFVIGLIEPSPLSSPHLVVVVGEHRGDPVDDCKKVGFKEFSPKCLR